MKLKLFDQARKHEKALTGSTRKIKGKAGAGIAEETKTQKLIDRVPLESQPFLRSILESYVRKNRSEFDWNDQGELILDSKVLPGSDVAGVFQYLMTNAKGPAPANTDAVHAKLLHLGVPRGWIVNEVFKSQQAATYAKRTRPLPVVERTGETGAEATVEPKELSRKSRARVRSPYQMRKDRKARASPAWLT